MGLIELRSAGATPVRIARRFRRTSPRVGPCDRTCATGSAGGGGPPVKRSTQETLREARTHFGVDEPGTLRAI